MKTTITIESSIYGSYEYEGNYEILIKDEELTSIQILNLILSKIVIYKLSINSKEINNKKDLINKTYKLLKNKEDITIQYWNVINWSETRIKIIQNKEDL
jgi:hypothetical protein